MKRTNRPEKGSTIWVEPIRSQGDIQRISTLLADRPRDLALFVVGVNTSLNARDLLRLKVGQVRRIKPGDRITVRGFKSGRPQCVIINDAIHDALQRHLAEFEHMADDELLFRSRKGGGVLSMSYFNRRVKSWCKEVSLKGNFGSQTLRKTFGYLSYAGCETDLDGLMALFGHYSRKQTADYLGIPLGRTEAACRDLSGRAAAPKRSGEVPEPAESYVIHPPPAPHRGPLHPDVP